jgi:hypothetical protein
MPLPPIPFEMLYKYPPLISYVQLAREQPAEENGFESGTGIIFNEQKVMSFY